MSENNAVATIKRVSLVETMAGEYGMEASPFLDAVKQTVMPGNATNAQIAAFLQVAHQHSLNPFIREIFAFPTRNGGIQPVISVDGWLSIANSNTQFDGYDYEEITDEKGKLTAGVITIYRKDRTRPFIHKEYLSECKRNTDPWNTMEHRMLENRTTAQGIRRCFGVSGVMDRDEAEQMNEINITSESTVMQKETLTKAEALKEKIGAKKAKVPTEAEVRQAAVDSGGAASTELKVMPETLPEPAAMEAAFTQPDPADDLGGLLDTQPLPPARAPESTLTDEERKAIIDILKSKAPNEQANVRVQAEARKFFASIGAKSTKDIQFKDYNACLDWAKALTV